mmetsp:Transcript_23075/g.64034  ORF Transcript_23075/g.64034 Transcript_23075/m.64034 type:complete len:348 (-) Transcript_23075:703-1746(-)
MALHDALGADVRVRAGMRPTSEHVPVITQALDLRPQGTIIDGLPALGIVQAHSVTYPSGEIDKALADMATFDRVVRSMELRIRLLEQRNPQFLLRCLGLCKGRPTVLGGKRVVNGNVVEHAVVVQADDVQALLMCVVVHEDFLQHLLVHGATRHGREQPAIAKRALFNVVGHEAVHNQLAILPLPRVALLGRLTRRKVGVRVVATCRHGLEELLGVDPLDGHLAILLALLFFPPAPILLFLALSPDLLLDPPSFLLLLAPSTLLLLCPAPSCVISSQLRQQSLRFLHHYVLQPSRPCSRELPLQVCKASPGHGVLQVSLDLPQPLQKALALLALVMRQTCLRGIGQG